MPKYAVDVATWFYVDTDNPEAAYDAIHAHLCDIVDDFEIVNIKEMEDA